MVTEKITFDTDIEKEELIQEKKLKGFRIEKIQIRNKGKDEEGNDIKEKSLIFTDTEPVEKKKSLEQRVLGLEQRFNDTGL